MDTTKKCSLIVSVYNQSRQLALLLASALKQTEQSYEIILADDGSSDDLLDYIKRFKVSHPHIQLKHVSHEDQGFRKTIILNAAVKLSSTPYLIFIDGDMILHHRFVEMHLKHANPKYVMCGWRGCKIKEPTAKRLIAQEETFSTQTLAVFWRALKRQMISPMRTLIIESKFLRKLFCKERQHLGGCNYGIHKRNFEKCNGMDETILQYGYEDIELGWRLHNNGIEVLGIRNCANTYHLEHGKSGNPGIQDVNRRIRENQHLQCMHGLKQLNSGSTNQQFIGEQ